jgi:protein-S-isoprenylcysteine O-methyltransferase Ste14
MSDDDPFRVAIVVWAAMIGPAGAYHRIRAHTGEKIDRWQEGVFILLGLRLTAAVMFVAWLAWLINPAWLEWSRLPLPAAVRWAGIALAGGGGVFWVWALHHLGKNLTDTVVTRRQHSLVTSGPYRWVRHPFYVGLVLILFGVSVATANWLILALAALLWFGFLLPRTRIEERNLIERFGDDYREYTGRVGRFWPRLRR